MSSFQKLLLAKADSTTASTTNWALYNKPSGTFDSTETSMYAEVIGLASTTYYGGASLGNQTERYLMAVAFKETTSSGTVYDGQTSATYSSATTSTTMENILTPSSSPYTYTPNHQSFIDMQTSLEDDGKHFISTTWTISGTTYDRYFLFVDKNSLGGGSGSSSSSGTSLTSWAYSSQSSTDPNTLIDWTTPTPDYSITADTTDWQTDLIAKITAKGLTIQDLVNAYALEHANIERQLNPNSANYTNNLIEYINKKLNTQ